MDAYTELRRTGAIGDAGLALMRRLMGQMTRTSSFPPPDGYGGWSDAAVDDKLGDLFCRKGPALVLDCAAKATGQASLERLLLAAIRNFMIDEAKGTPQGKLRRRLTGLLDKDARFIRASAPGWQGWALADGPTGSWQGDIDDLVAAASAVRGVVITRWNAAGPTPKATVRALLMVVEAVLQAAGGAVRDQDITRVVELRFGLMETPVTVPLYAYDDPATGQRMPVLEPAALEDPEGESLTATTAEQILESLTPAERALVSHLDQPTEELCQIVGRDLIIAEAIAEGLKAKLVGPPAEQERVGALVHLVDERHGLAVEQWPGPSASLEPVDDAAAVLIRSAVSCTTPSTDTCVLVVGFMIAVPFSLGRSWRAASHSCYEHVCADPAPASRISFDDFLVRRLQAIRQRDGSGATSPDYLDSVTTLREMHG